jgi:uncharacterized YccA/Bax inhibitor family protein
MRTGNPVLSGKAFGKQATQALYGEEVARGDAMTVQGTVNRTAALLVLLVVAAAGTWMLAARGSSAAYPFMIGGLIGGLVLALVTCFRPQSSAITAPLYAICEGLFLGGISRAFHAAYPGIVAQAVALTMGVALVMLALYKFRVIRVTGRFLRGVVAATGAVFLAYLASFLLNLFGVAVPYIHGSGPIGIGFSVAVVIIAALNLVLDFHLIETGAQQAMPKYMEWYGAFAIMVTLVWLYIEILRLLAKLQARR